VKSPSRQLGENARLVDLNPRGPVVLSLETMSRGRNADCSCPRNQDGFDRQKSSVCAALGGEGTLSNVRIVRSVWRLRPAGGQLSGFGLEMSGGWQVFWGYPTWIVPVKSMAYPQNVGFVGFL
jgi:hypothetical protein